MMLIPLICAYICTVMPTIVRLRYRVNISCNSHVSYFYGEVSTEEDGSDLPRGLAKVAFVNDGFLDLQENFLDLFIFGIAI